MFHGGGIYFFQSGYRIATYDNAYVLQIVPQTQNIAVKSAFSNTSTKTYNIAPIFAPLTVIIFNSFVKMLIMVSSCAMALA